MDVRIELPAPGEDATPLIQRTLDEISAAGGGTLRLAPGIWLLHQIAHVPHDVRFGPG